MAKKVNKNYDVTGLSIRDIMDIDLDKFNRLSERELKQITSRLVSAANKRIRAFEKKDISSPAVRSLGVNNRFSVKLKDVDITQRVNTLKHEFARARRFLIAKTSTMTGYKQYQKDVKEEVESAIGRKVTKGEITHAFEILHKAQQAGIVDGKRGSAGSMQGRQIVFDILSETPNIDDDNFMTIVEHEYENWYEEKQNKK